MTNERTKKTRSRPRFPVRGAGGSASPAAAGRGALPILALTAFLAACGNGPDLEARTFELRHLDPGEAVEMVAPYIYTDRPDGPGAVTSFSGGITVRETEDNLQKIARVLEEHDRPEPGVRLHFQIIEADGFEGDDDRIRDVEAALRQLFRFEGYRLVAEAQMAAMEGSASRQVFEESGREFGISARVEQVRATRAGSGTVVLSVELRTIDLGSAIETTMAVPVGQTVVLGSAKPPGAPTLILIVRPELVPLPDAG